MRWVEKTPTHVFHAGQIAASMPDALFVEVVRDPRDVLASKKTRTATVWTSDRYLPEQRRRKHFEKSFDPLWDAVCWKSAVRAGSEARDRRPKSWFRVRYEDLVGDPEAVVQELCQFLGVAFSPGLLEVARGIPADPDELACGKAGIASSSVGRWSGVLDSVETEICRRVCRREMRELGYQAERTAGTFDVVRRVMTQSGPGLAVRLYHRFRLGGARYLLEVLKGYRLRFRKLRTKRQDRAGVRSG